MRFFVVLAVVLAVFAMSGCFGASMGLRSQGVEYSASGFMGPTPMEAASADLMSAQADRVRAEAQAMQAHPELFMGWRGYGSYYGGYGRVDPFYYYPAYGYTPASAPATTIPALETRATGLEQRASGLEQDAARLERLLREHIAEERSQP